jgi:hypothetical protein
MYTTVRAQAPPPREIFGPEYFVRGGGRDLSTRTFLLPEFISSPVTVRVQNGNPDGTRRLTNGHVKINGIEVVSPIDFGLGVAVIQKTVTLASPSRNTMTVDLGTDPNPGSFALVTISGLATTNLLGRVLDETDRPLAGVLVSIGNVSVRTDLLGNFLLQGLPSGTQALEIQGTSIGPYPDIRHKVELLPGRENILPYAIYLTRLDIENGVAIDPNRDTFVTTPLLPGASLLVYAGSALNPDGSPFTGRISITRIAPDK